jgi:hypothetical protein
LTKTAALEKRLQPRITRDLLENSRLKPLLQVFLRFGFAGGQEQRRERRSLIPAYELE